jgi:quinol monooxygenase YgiN
MYGLIVRITAAHGKRSELTHILSSSAANMPGCLSYVIAEDPADANTLWITETWESRASHDASLELRVVQEAIPLARPLIANFERIAETRPVWSAERCD